jgi:effector-binding domain-containing protein
MIEKIGVKTTSEELVAYMELNPGENELIKSGILNKQLREMHARIGDPQMVIYYGSKDDPDVRREVAVPVEHEVEGIKTKVMPSVKVAFLVYIGTDKPVNYYVETLMKYIEDEGYKLGDAFHCIEAVFQPDEFNLSYGSFVDEDAPEYWRNEIMIPVKE